MFHIRFPSAHYDPAEYYWISELRNLYYKSELRISRRRRKKNSLRLKGLSGGRDERTRACSKRSDSGVQTKNIESGGKNKKGLAKEDSTFKSIGAHRIF